MKFEDGWWWPDGEQHMIEWLANPKNRYELNGRVAYQGKKQVAASHLCKSYRTAVDVGSHVGLWSYNLANRFRMVHAFEPVAAHRECFARNVDLPNVQLYPCALGEKSEMVNIWSNPTSSGDSWVKGEGDIPMRRLDDLAIPEVDLVKIDTEGHELFVLKGAVETLKKWHPAIVVEQKPRHAQRYGLGEQDAVLFLQTIGAKLRLEISGDFFMSWDA